MKSEVIEAIKMLAKEKEIPEETLFHTIEEALKAAEAVIETQLS